MKSTETCKLSAERCSNWVAPPLTGPTTKPSILGDGSKFGTSQDKQRECHQRHQRMACCQSPSSRQITSASCATQSCCVYNVGNRCGSVMLRGGCVLSAEPAAALRGVEAGAGSWGAEELGTPVASYLSHGPLRRIRGALYAGTVGTVHC